MGFEAAGQIRTLQGVHTLRLHPRLSPGFARRMYEEQSRTPLGEIAGSTSHPHMTWAATGAPRVKATELESLQQAMLDAAGRNGAPNVATQKAQQAFDRDAARILWEWPHLTPAEAGVPGVWSFLALVLVPDVVRWRAAGSSNVERYVASDLTRHTLARLWWRAHLFTYGLDDPEAGWTLWRESDIGEADLDQIQTRRGGYGRSPSAFRSLVAVYPEVVRLADAAGIDRRRFWRDAFLRWILRLGAFIDFGSLSEDSLREDFLAVARELATAVPAAPADSDAPYTARTEETRDYESFDDVPLRDIAVILGEAVRAGSESVEETGLLTAFETLAGLTLPPGRAEIVLGIAWQAKTLNYIDANTPGPAAWRPGKVPPAPDRRWHDWSINSFAAHLRESEEYDLDTVCGQLFAGRAGRTVKRVARLAMTVARD
jgi:hypothetical protein